MTKHTPATPLRQQIIDAALRAGNLDDRRAIHQLWFERTKLVEALRKVGTPACLTTSQRHSLLRELGEE